MKKTTNKMIAIVMLTVIIIMGWMALADAHDFRETDWGMSLSEVMRTESAEELAGPKKMSGIEMMVYGPVYINGLEYEIVYIFVNDKLCRAKYMLQERYYNGVKYLIEFAELLDVLEEKYGEPDSGEAKWMDDTYKYDSDNWGLALMLGDLLIFKSWELAETTVFAFVGDQHGVSIEIEYSSVKYSNLEAEAKVQGDKDKL